MWRRSSRCDNDLCLLVAPGSRTVWLRDSTSTGQVPVLAVDHGSWRALLAEIRSGRWDR